MNSMRFRAKSTNRGAPPRARGAWSGEIHEYSSIPADKQEEEPPCDGSVRGFARGFRRRCMWIKYWVMILLALLAGTVTYVYNDPGVGWKVGRRSRCGASRIGLPCAGHLGDHGRLDEGPLTTTPAERDCQPALAESFPRISGQRWTPHSRLGL